MNEAHDPYRTIDMPPEDSLEAGLVAGFGNHSRGPSCSLTIMQPVLLKEVEGESNHVVKPHSDAMPQKEQAGDRYQLFGEIARGGMGAVLRGRDADLGRDLAVKVLLEKHADTPEMVRRFLEEAQVGAQLQHPGVVPVYDVGHFGGRPFFTMKLVKGHTLSALLAARADPSVDRPRFLAITLQASQAMAYAHAKGVIHRDLKPANIMVGAFGEVQVMDWGLSKVLQEGGVADKEKTSRQHRDESTLIRPARGSGSTEAIGTQTEAGTLLGTPAYMPPEQANGDVTQLDRRADVFGLGAILCEVLTGKPPYTGHSLQEVYRKAANGDLADAFTRLDGCGADAELIALTRACLAPEVSGRPRDARAVADALTAYLDGVQERLQTAQRERAVAVAREAEQRKRRQVQLALAAALVALLLAGGAFAWWRSALAQAGRERDARNAEAVAALLGQAEQALMASDAAKAQVALDAAKKRSAEGGAEEQEERLGRLEADLALLRELDEADQFRWTVIDNTLPGPVAAARQTREALAKFGVGPDKVSQDEAAARVSASAVRERIVPALDRLLLPIRLVVPARLPAKLRADVAALLPMSARVRALLRRVDADPYRDAVRDAVLAENRKKFRELAGQKAALEQPAGFVAFLGESEATDVRRRRQLLRAAVRRRPENLGLLMVLGKTYPVNKKEGANERVRWYQAAVAVAPSNMAAHNNLGVALSDKGQVDEAIACYRKAIELGPRNAGAHSNLGKALRGRGKSDEAIACFKKAIALCPEDALPHYNLGNALKDKGQLEEAIAEYNKAIALAPKFAPAHCNLGNALKGKGQLDEAIAAFKKASTLDAKLANAQIGLGMALSDKGKVDEAIACLNKAIEIDPKDATAHINLGAIHCDIKRDYAKAIACFKKAIELNPKNARAHSNLGRALSQMGKMDEAIVCYKKAVQLCPQDARAEARYSLGNALKDKGQMDEAIAEYNKAIALAPKHAEAHCNLGHALSRLGRFAEALASLKRGHELGTKRPDWRYPSAAWVRNARRLAALETRLSAFLNGEHVPSGTRERLDLARVSQAKKFHHTATRLYAEAFADGPKLGDDQRTRYNAARSAALAAAGQGKDSAKLDEKERRALRRRALTWLRANLALLSKQAETGKPAGRTAVQQALRHWQKAPDLASLRDKEALAKLTPEERAACEKLWSDVAELLKKHSMKPAKEGKP
jgi:tetratricopeptide (TPR) repeat protein